VTTVKEILDKKGTAVVSAKKTDNVFDTARKMNEKRIGAVIVTEGEHVVGIFTERDILSRVVAAGRDPKTTKVGEAMTSPVACCRRDTTVEECRDVMSKKRIRHLPVVEDNKLLGIITSGDILAREVTAHEETIRYLHDYIYGPY